MRVRFLCDHGVAGFFVLGCVFLAVTGAEALYADMGHFGRRPIQARLAVLVLPCAALNYLGQGALLLSRPGRRSANPFFQMAPTGRCCPLVLLATVPP